jgi:hypothetical protein
VTLPSHPPACSSDTAHLTFSRNLGGSFSPSDCVKSPSSIEKTVLDPGGPRYGRPSDRHGPPTTLFDRSLAGLQYDLEHLDALTPSETAVCNAHSLISHSTGFFGEEYARELFVRDDLASLLSGEGIWQQSTADGVAKPGGVWFEGPYVYLIFELKNEPGLGGDPFLQSLVVYNKIIKDEKV